MTPSARTIWGSKRKIFRGQYNIGARGQFALDFPHPIKHIRSREKEKLEEKIWAFLPISYSSFPFTYLTRNLTHYVRMPRG